MGDRAQRTKETSARLLEKWGVNGTSRDSTREKGQWTLERERVSTQDTGDWLLETT